MHNFYPRCYFASLRMNCCGLQVSPSFDLVSDAPYAYQLPTSFRGFSKQKREKSLSRAFAMQARCTFCISYVQFFTGPFIGQKKRCSPAVPTFSPIVFPFEEKKNTLIKAAVFSNNLWIPLEPWGSRRDSVKICQESLPISTFEMAPCK